MFFKRLYITIYSVKHLKITQNAQDLSSKQFAHDTARKPTHGITYCLKLMEKLC